MSTIPGLSASNLYSYLSSINAGSSINQSNYAAQIQASQLSAITTLTSSSNNSSSPLTYNAAGLLGSLQPTTPTKVNTSSAQAAQYAAINAQFALNQTFNSLTTSSSGV